VSFTSYLRRVKGLVPLGQLDFIKDWLADREKPRGVKTWGEVRAYLEGRHADTAAVERARELWRDYERFGK